MVPLDKQRFKSLQVIKRADAIREAHRLAQRLETQTQPLAERTNIKLGEIVDGSRAFYSLRQREPVFRGWLDSLGMQNVIWNAVYKCGIDIPGEGNQSSDGVRSSVG